MDEVLEFLNKVIRAEKGNRVTIDSMFKDAELDSFGTVMVLLEMDKKYEYLSKCKYANIGDDIFSNIPYETLTILEIVETCK